MTGPDHDELVLRPATEADGAFLFSVYAATRRDEFAAVDWEPTQVEALLKMQFDMRSRWYAVRWPAAEQSIILFRGGSAGTIIVDPGQEISLVDIAILPELRGRGIAETVLRRLQARDKPIVLKVDKGNDVARGLYKKLGFHAAVDYDTMIQMRWTPED